MLRQLAGMTPKREDSAGEAGVVIDAEFGRELSNRQNLAGSCQWILRVWTLDIGEEQGHAAGRKLRHEP